MQKLKVAANWRQNPGLSFLQECWNDDPALQIAIKKLLAKFGQWGIACVDGCPPNRAVIVNSHPGWFLTQSKRDCVVFGVVGNNKINRDVITRD